LRVIERVTQQRIEEMKMPTVADVNELRLVKFKEKVTAAVLSGAGKEFQPLLEQIEAEANIPAIEIAAAIASLMQGTTPLLLTQKEEAPKGPPAIDGSVPTSTYRLAVGHAHGVLPGNIVGSIANEAGIEGKRIGHIDIRDDHSYVDLPTLPDDMLSLLQKTRVRGEELRITRVDSKPDKPKFSGQSRRPDRMEEEGGRRPYMGGGSRYKEGGSEFVKRPAYKGTPRFSEGGAEDGRASKPQRFSSFAPAGDSAPAAGGEAGESRPRFEKRERPAYGDKPSFGDKPRFGGKPGFGGKPAFGKKPGFGSKPSFAGKSDGFKKTDGFKKKFTGKAAGAKGSYKGGKAFRDKAK
jgi:DbpA RNA binding domain